MHCPQSEWSEDKHVTAQQKKKSISRFWSTFFILQPSSSSSFSPRHSLVTLSLFSINWPCSNLTLGFNFYFLAIVWVRTSFLYQILRCSPVSTPSQLSINLFFVPIKPTFAFINNSTSIYTTLHFSSHS